MDYSYIIRRSLQITWNYKALWIFGVLLAITTGSASRGSTTSSGGVPGAPGMPDVPGIPWPPPQIPAFPFELVNALVTVVIVLICLFFLLGIAALIVRYVAETGAIRMVDLHEANGEKLPISDGFRLGWSIRAFRFFLIDLLFFILIFLLSIFMLIFAASPLLLWLVEADPARIIGTAAAVGLFLLVILLFIVIAIVYSLLSQFFRRAVIMEHLGVFEGIRRGFSLVKGNLGGVIVVGIILLFISVIFGILMIPVFFGVLLTAAILGALPGLLAGWIAAFFTEGSVPIITGFFFGFPVFFLALFAPLIWLGGLFEIFLLSAWTLTYRQVAGMMGRPSGLELRN